MTPPFKSIAAVGDVSNISTWSGIPYYFWQATLRADFAQEPWRLDLSRFGLHRRVWNVKQLLLLRGVGGFQYSREFLDQAEKQIPSSLFSTEVISFNQTFPRASTVIKNKGVLNHYIDAPFVAFTRGKALELNLPKIVARRACELERENYAASRRIITMARWAAAIAASECGVPPGRIFTILPGANLDLPLGWSFPKMFGRPGKERDFVLGFIGADWKRKGLPFLLKIREDLAQRSWKVVVHAAGVAPKELLRERGLRFVGFVDKRTEPNRFLDVVSGCDLGCLFSSQEALGISTLEFLRAGVPVAGFAHEGPADTLPPDAGFRFAISASATDIADQLDAYLSDETLQKKYRENAQKWSPLVTWDRCVKEFQELWATGAVSSQVQPWLGLPNAHPTSDA